MLQLCQLLEALITLPQAFCKLVDWLDKKFSKKGNE